MVTFCVGLHVQLLFLFGVMSNVIVLNFLFGLFDGASIFWASVGVSICVCLLFARWMIALCCFV